MIVVGPRARLLARPCRKQAIVEITFRSAGANRLGSELPMVRSDKSKTS
jgi:hypothetical protein